MTKTLNAQILEAHAKGDDQALVPLYTAAADCADTTDAECFFLTTAYIFALEQDHPDTNALKTRLRKHGRE